jgi:hypothetical protein
VAERAHELFARYADAYAAGERPQARAYLAAAGAEADELAALIDGFLARAPARPPSAESVELMEAFLAEEPPLVALRAARGIRVEEVVARLVAELALPAEAAAKVKQHYQRLEQGLLDAGRVSERVWEVLARVLPGARQLARVVPPPAAPEPAYYRSSARGPFAAPVAAALDEPDETDTLFGVGRSAY